MDFSPTKTTFEELIKRYDYTFVDAGALNGDISGDIHLAKQHSADGVRNSQRALEIHKESIAFFLDMVDRGYNFYLTERVKGEIRVAGGEIVLESTKRGQRNLRGFGGEYYGKRRRLSRLTDRLIRELERRQTVVGPGSFTKPEVELYKTLYSQCGYLRDKHNLSYTDFDLLIMGAVFSDQRGSTAVVSNDRGIFDATMEYIGTTQTDLSLFCPYRRWGPNFFKNFVGDGKSNAF